MFVTLTPSLRRCLLRQQRRGRVGLPGLTGPRRQTVRRREPEEETPPEPDHVHHLPASRAGESLREVPLPGRVQQRGAGAEGQPAGGPRPGVCAPETAPESPRVCS